VCRTWDGGWAVCGYTLQRRQPDVSVARFAPDGTRLWSVVVGTALADYGYALAALPDGSLLVVGSTTPAGSRYSDVYLLKLDSTGQLRWSRTFGDSLWDEARAVVVMPDNGLAVAGFSSSYGVGMDCYLLRLDSTGQGLWFRTYGRDPSERAHGVAATAGGGIVLVGESEPAAGGSADAYVVRTDPEGGVVWERHWGGDGHDGASAVSVLDDRGLAIVGETESDSLSGPDFYFVRTDSLGGVGIELADRQDRDGRGSGRPTLLRGPIPVRPGGTRVFGADGRLVRSLGRSQTAWDGRDDAGRVVGAGLFCLLPADGAALRVVRVR